MFTNALTTVATMLILLSIGFFFAWKGWLTQEGNSLLSSLVIKIALPGTILSTMLTTFTRSDLTNAAVMLIVPLISLIFWRFASRYIAKLVGVPKGRRGVFTTLAAFSNTVFIGFPVVRAILGEEAIPYATICYLANTTVFWVLGVGDIQRDALDNDDVHLNVISTLKSALKRLMSAPFVTLLFCIILILLQFSLPAPIMNAASSVGALVTPISMIFIGSMLCKVTRTKLKWERGFAPLLLIRYVIAPGLMAVVCVIAGIRGLPAQVFVLQTGMATMTQVAIIAHGYGADSSYAALGIALTTICLMIVLPLFALLLPYLA